VRPQKPRTREFCGGCHDPDEPSPKEVPRIDLATHGGRNLCWQCHYPHYPELD
jgi:ribosomal protein S27AE